VPLFYENQIIRLRIRGVDCEGRILYETNNRVVVSLESDLIPRTGETVEGHLQQGNFQCSFSTKIQNMELGLRDRKWILDLAYPATFKRSLDQAFRKK